MIEQKPPGIGSFLLGLAVGAGIGASVRSAHGRRDAARSCSAARVSRRSGAGPRFRDHRVGRQTLSSRRRIKSKAGSIPHADAVELKSRQVTNAVDAGRAAAQQARVELEQRIAETKAAYKES